VALVSAPAAPSARVTKHRAYRRLSWERADSINIAVLTGALTIAVAATLPWIAAGWHWALTELLGLLELHGEGTVRASGSLPFVRLTVEAPGLASTWPTATQLGAGWIATGLAGVLSGMLYRRWLPLGVIAGFLTAVQLVTQVFFTLADGPFPLGLGMYLLGFQRWALLLLGLSPLLLAATFFVFPIPLWRKSVVGLGLVAHLSVLVPLQGALLAYAVTHASALVLPLGSIVLGLPLDILVYIAFFAWGMSGGLTPARQA
jgi:hypothetical protein